MELYSIKMRGEKDKSHISGAENIVSKDKIEDVVGLLVKRALEHSKGEADFINLKIEKVNDEEVEYLSPLLITTVNVKNKEEGFKGIEKILMDIGISKRKVLYAIELLQNIRDMRGAILLDINTLERLENDKSRGVRVTYMDLENRDIDGLTKTQKYNTHLIEAVVLATKVIEAPGIIAEICYSDDVDYTAGYVATKQYGYTRFDYLKEKGNPFGGRVFIYDGDRQNVSQCIDYLENKKVIVRDNLIIRESIDIELLLKEGF
ncbi:MAG: 6-carboxyhexanoate--CoA ligase [Sarcina sp.]